jgi:hypothetical protein
VTLFLNRNNKSYSVSENSDSLGEKSSCEAYRKSCFNLYKKLMNPDPKTLFRPPLKIDQLSKEIYEAFTPKGEMKFGKNFYINEIYSDASSADKVQPPRPVDINRFNNFREKVKKWQPLGYSDVELHKKMDKYKNDIRSKSMVN